MVWANQCWLAGIILVIIYGKGTTSIRITNVHVPDYLEVGKGGELDCTWAEENDRMYSIKWYQAAHEFYRYTPNTQDPIQIFDPPTLDVDRQKSWAGSVRIANVTLGATGPFHCEVSGEGPTFHTDSDQALLKVIDLPDGEPVIQGVKSQYRAREWVDITCTSRRSKPAPRLTYKVNQKPVTPSWVEPQVNRKDADGLTSSSLRMRFSLAPWLLEDGYARVSCTATIPDIYDVTSNDIISTIPPYQASVLDGGRGAGGRAELCPACFVALTALVICSLHHQVL